MPQRAGAVSQNASIRWEVLTSFQPLEGREQPDADVDRAVADRENPPIPGQMVPVAVPQVEVALDPGLIVVRTGEIAANRHAQRVGAVAGGAERPAEARVRPVGDDHVAGPDDLGGARVGPPDDRAVEDPALERRARSPPPRARGSPRPSPRARPPSGRARGGGPRSRSRGSRGGRATRARGSRRGRSTAARRSDGTPRAGRRDPCRAVGARPAGSGRHRTSSRAGNASSRRGAHAVRAPRASRPRPRPTVPRRSRERRNDRLCVRASRDPFAASRSCVPRHRSATRNVGADTPCSTMCPRLI